MAVLNLGVGRKQTVLLPSGFEPPERCVSFSEWEHERGVFRGRYERQRITNHQDQSSPAHKP